MKSESEIQRDVELACAAHRRLLTDLDELEAAGELDVTRPSRLPDWTIGHVITHVTNSGIGHLGILDGAALGDVVAQYPHGPEGRNADIEAGATRPAAEQVAALRTSIERLESAWDRPSWAGSGIAPNGAEVAVADLPFFRIRETTVHHVDLGIGFEFADLDSTYVRLELRWMEMQWKARQPMGMTSLPDDALALEPTDRLAWLLGRTEIDGVDPARIF